MNEASISSISQSLANEAMLPRATLDIDYNARGSVQPAVFEANMQAYRVLSDECRAACLEQADIIYDTASGQTLDILGDGKGAARPVFIFIHGGYWRALSKRDSLFMASMLARHGIATAVIDYRLAPSVSLREIVREARAACAFLWHESGRLGVDRDRMFIGGSSAGAHLAATVLSGGWHAGQNVPDDLIKGALLVSGIYHLAPIARSFAQEWAALDDAAVQDLSPAENLPVCGSPVFTAYAAVEAAGFTRQSRAFHGMLAQARIPTRLLEIPDRNHFDVILDLGDEASTLGRALVEMMLPA